MKRGNAFVTGVVDIYAGDRVRTFDEGQLVLKVAKAECTSIGDVEATVSPTTKIVLLVRAGEMSCSTLTCRKFKAGNATIESCDPVFTLKRAPREDRGEGPCAATSS